MKNKKLKVSEVVYEPQENSSVEKKKLEVDQVRPLNHHQPQYPNGFRFLPTDVELLRDYVMNKFYGKPVPVPINEIQEVEVYKYSPEELAETYKIPNQNRIYVFTDMKQKRGSRGKRLAGRGELKLGKWKLFSGKGAVPIKEGDKRLGVRTTYQFLGRKEDKNSNPKWLMQEYALTDPDKFKAVLLDGFVLCCIYKKEKKAVQKAGDFIVSNEELVPSSLSAAITISTSIEEHFKSFPSGLLFSPTDTELVVYYLWVKNNFGGRYLPINRIHEVELYNYHPQHLTEMYKLCREDGWYFFVRENWTPSAIGDGFWQLETKRHEPLQHNIDSSSAVKCRKLPLKYVEKQKQSDGDIKVWKMLQYSITIPDAETGKQVKQYWNLCKIWCPTIERDKTGKATDDQFEGRNIGPFDLNEEPPEESDDEDA